jgi:hypothetical protein
MYMIKIAMHAYAPKVKTQNHNHSSQNCAKCAIDILSSMLMPLFHVISVSDSEGHFLSNQILYCSQRNLDRNTSLNSEYKIRHGNGMVNLSRNRPVTNLKSGFVYTAFSLSTRYYRI